MLRAAEIGLSVCLGFVVASCTGAAARTTGERSQERESRVAVHADKGSGDWTIEVGEPGAAVIRYRNTEVGRFVYAFWGPSWAWAGTQVRLTPARGRDAFTVEVPDLGVSMDGVIRREKSGLSFAYTITTTKPIDDVVGGGVEFNLKLDSPVFAGNTPDVTLLHGDRGFRWSINPAESVSATLDQGIPSVTFEQGHKEKIRFYILSKRIRPGRVSRTLTIRLPAGGAVQPSLAERYGPERGPDWAPDTLPWNQWPVDVSFLSDGDRPAGRHGRVRVVGDALVFADGTPARFWGTNLAAYALFVGERPEIARQAKRLAALGYNLVRIHHHDSVWVTPNVIAQGSDTQQLNDPALDSLDWWIKCLRDQGIYVWLDLKVGRTFRQGDGIPGFDELSKGEPTGRGFDYVSPRLQELERTFAAKYLAHVNRYTGRAYADDPAIAAVLLMNEDDLTTHFGNLMLPDKGSPVHAEMLRGLVAQSAETLHVSMRDAMRLWEPGPARLVLADLEARFYRRSIADLRQHGYSGLVVSTSYWGGESLSSIPSLTVGDLIDVHSYGEAESLSTNPRFEANFLSWIGAAQVSGKPLSITEWNVPFPTRDRFTAPLYLASIAALQGWDAPMLFAYMQDGIAPPVRVGEWSSGYDPALTALIPAAAVLFRQQHVHQARQTYRFAPNREALYYRTISPTTSAAIRTLVEQSRLVFVPPDVKELEWYGPFGPKAPSAIEVTDPDRDFIPAGENRVRSDTGELERDWVAGTQTIDTPMTQAAAGWIGGRRIALRDVELRVETAKATVALTSLDGRPLQSSKNILVSAVAQASSSPGDRLPFLAQPVSATIVLRSSQAGMTLTPLTANGEPPATGAPTAPGSWKSTALERAGDRYTFKLPSKPVTHWFLLRPTR